MPLPKGKTSKRHRKLKKKLVKELKEEFEAVCRLQHIDRASRLHARLNNANITLSQSLLCDGFKQFVFQAPKTGITELIEATEEIFFNLFELQKDRITTELFCFLFETFSTTVVLIPWIRFFKDVIGLEMTQDDRSLYALFDELCCGSRWFQISKEVFQLGLELCVVESGLYIDIPSPEETSLEMRRMILSKPCNHSSEFLMAGCDPDNESDGFELDPQDEHSKRFQIQLYDSYHSYRSLYFRTPCGKNHFQAICDAVRSYFVFEEDAFDAITPVITEFLFGSAHAPLSVTRTFPSKSPSINACELSPQFPSATPISRETSTLSDVGNFI